MFGRSLLSVVVAAVFAAAAGAATTPPEAGKYAGRTTVDASGKPRAIVLTVKKSGCGNTAYCFVVSPESFVQGKCAATGYMYAAFFPVAAAIPIPASGRVDHTYTLYVSDGSIVPGPGGGAVPSGRLQLSLSFAGGKVTGTERVTIDLHEGDGVCDTGLVKITASR